LPFSRISSLSEEHKENVSLKECRGKGAWTIKYFAF
jgi:hypothetical protein